MIHITDNFVWLDVTKKCKSSIATLELNSAHELYEVGDDGIDSLIEDVDTIPSLIKWGQRICIEVGHLPEKNKQKNVWRDTDKQLINGFWYVKIRDIK